MARTVTLRYWVAAVVLLALSGCAAHKLYRTDYTLCRSEDPVTQCKAHALQEYTGDRGAYLLGFIEFDDQGQLFDRRQMRAVLDKLYEDSASQDLIIVVFVHGWKHGAAPGDDNVQTFRQALMELSAAESQLNRMRDDPQMRGRKIAGVYLGWRGASVTAPLLKELTFWDRKKTAHKVGQGGVTEVLNRLELVRKTKDSLEPSGRSRTRLVVVGHSFGGAVVFTALSQILEGRFVHTRGPTGQVSDVDGFGSLIVLINPAFEALRFTPLSDMSTERGTYFPAQLPVLAILTSEADDATKRAFPFGRWFSTLFEKERVMVRHNGTTGEDESIDEGRANVTAVGHFEPYRTHYLRAAEAEGEAVRQAPSARESVELFLETSRGWENDTPGSTLSFGATRLERTEDSAGRNPYLVARVDKRLIRDHNDIDEPGIIEFVKQLILITSQSETLEVRRDERAGVAAP